MCTIIIHSLERGHSLKSYSTPDSGTTPRPTARGRVARRQLEELHRQCREDSQAAFLSLPANTEEGIKQGGSHSYQDSGYFESSLHVLCMMLSLGVNQQAQG